MHAPKDSQSFIVVMYQTYRGFMSIDQTSRNKSRLSCKCDTTSSAASEKNLKGTKDQKARHRSNASTGFRFIQEMNIRCNKIRKKKQLWEVGFFVRYLTMLQRWKNQPSLGFFQTQGGTGFGFLSAWVCCFIRVHLFDTPKCLKSLKKNSRHLKTNAMPSGNSECPFIKKK